jgi:DNA-binding transcriptional LysR family regulator
VDIGNSMRMFTKVAELNSFARAAESLDVAVPRISRAIADLEDHLGTRLLQRTTRRMSLTEAGRIYLDRCHQILGELDETYLMLSANAVSTSGRIRVVAPALFAMRKLSLVLTAYQRAYPNIVVDLVLADRSVDLIEEEFDLGILAARRVNALSLVSRHLTSTDFYTCAAPSYIAEHGAPAHPADMVHHPYIAFRTEHSNEDVTFQDSHGAEMVVHPKPALIANNIGMVRKSALAGMGIAILPAYLIDDDIRSGRLKRLLPQYRLADREFRIVYSNRKFLSLKVKAFIDIAIEHFRHATETP